MLVKHIYSCNATSGYRLTPSCNYCYYNNGTEEAAATE